MIVRIGLIFVWYEWKFRAFQPKTTSGLVLIRLIIQITELSIIFLLSLKISREMCLCGLWNNLQIHLIDVNVCAPVSGGRFWRFILMFNWFVLTVEVCFELIPRQLSQLNYSKFSNQIFDISRLCMFFFLNNLTSQRMLSASPMLDRT